MKGLATRGWMAGLVLVLTSCGQQEIAGPVNQLAAAPAAPRRSSPVTIPAFSLTNRISGPIRMPEGAALLEQWDEIQRQIVARPAGLLRDRIQASASQNLAKVDARKAAGLLVEWKDAVPSRWFEAAEVVVKELWKADPAEAETFINHQAPSSQQGGLWQRLLSSLPSGVAAQWVQRVPPGSRIHAAGTLISRWPFTDPQAAAAWFDDLAPGLTEEQFEQIAYPRYKVLGGGQFTYIEAYRRAMEAAKFPRVRRFFADKYQAEVRLNEPEKLVEITAAVEAGLSEAAPGAFRREVALNQMRQDPVGYLAALTPEEIGNLPDSFLSESISKWASEDSAAATRWALSMNRGNDVANGVGTWSRLDPAAATDFAFALPPGEMRDKSMDKLCTAHQMMRNFETAEKCLAEIQDPGIARLAHLNFESRRTRNQKKE